MKYFLKTEDKIEEVHIVSYKNNEYNIEKYDGIEEQWVGEIVPRSRLITDEELELK